ncbi:MAG: hypothetical protein AABW86_03345 [Candidatus Micrarchaeota archaeon]
MQKFFDQAKGCEVQMPKWVVAARQGLDKMNRLASALPLVEALRRSCSIFNGCKLNANVILDPGKSKERFFINGRTEKECSFLDFLFILGVLSKGAPIDAVYNKNTSDLVMLANERIPVVIKEPKNDSPAAFIRSLNDAIIGYRKTLLEINSRTFATTDAGFPEVADRNGRAAIVSARREMEDDVSYGADICVALALLRSVASRLSPEVSRLLADFLEYPNTHIVQEYVSLLSEISRTRAKGRDYILSALKSKFEIACPDAVEMLKSQSAVPPKIHSVGYIAESDNLVQQPVAPIVRTAREDEDYIKANFPRFYRMMTGPTDEERTRREFGHRLKMLIRHGVPSVFIKQCISDGVHDIGAIEERYTSFQSRDQDADSRILSPAEVFHLPIPAYTISSPERGTIEIMPRVVSYDDFLSGITFSETVQKYISGNGNGLTSKGVVLSICKGFDFGKKSGGAVGGAHFRGAIIRNNIRRCGLEADRTLAFLDSLDLIIHHGGSARTKDDAMSININPDNELGKEILRTIIDALLVSRYSKVGTTNGK